jgi:hypothetical protein
MTKLTSHDKAILVGLHMSGGSCDGPNDLNTLDLELTKEWIETVLKEMQRRVSSKEWNEFRKKIEAVFFIDSEGVDSRYPEEYVDKLSPLAIAVWIATDATNFTRSVWTTEQRFDFCKTFNKKWSIKLDPIKLEPTSEDDEINLWLLTQRYLREFAPNKTPMFTAKYPRNDKLIYLSGGQQFAKDGGASWRSTVSPTLYRVGYDIFNPVFQGFAVHDKYGTNMDQLSLDDYIGAGGIFIEKDLEAIKNSDAVLTLINESAMKGAGTKGEALICVDYHIPNFFVLEEGFEARKLPIWLAGCIRDKKFLFEHNDFKRAIAAIKRSI